MLINIPIESLGARELVMIIRKYPKGIVKVVDKKSTWETDLDIMGTETVSNQQKPTGNVFSNMAESITSSFGG